MGNKPSTAIVGARASGLCCAIELHQFGLAGHARGPRMATAFLQG